MPYNLRSLRSSNPSTEATVAPRRPKKPGTADAGDLEKLPLEIRRMIYEFALPDECFVRLEAHQPRSEQHWVINGVEITHPARLEAAPRHHKRNSKRRGQKCIGKKWVEIPNKNALLQANKQIHAEAAPVLYGTNHFQFQTTRALEAFVMQIGEANRQLLDSILLIRPDTEGWKYNTSKGLAAQSRAMDVLKGAKGIRNIRIDGLPYLPRGTSLLLEQEADQEFLELHVEACFPVLETLKHHFSDSNLKDSILHVLWVTPDIEETNWHDEREDCIANRPWCQWCEGNRQRIARAEALLRIMMIGAHEIAASEELQKNIKEFENNGGDWQAFVANTRIKQFQSPKE